MQPSPSATPLPLPLPPAASEVRAVRAARAATAASTAQSRWAALLPDAAWDDALRRLSPADISTAR
eukprot:357123-Chlamydomonas_euryale.AAC.2